MKYVFQSVLLVLCLCSCGKKEWPQPIASDEMVRIDHIEARVEQDCLLVNLKLGGNLANLEFFLLEIEEQGCPTCPFSPTVVKKIFPFSEGVYRKENNFVLTVCRPLPEKEFRVRAKADNTYQIVQPAVSDVIAVAPTVP